MGLITENKVKCLLCKDIIESTDDNKDVECDCGTCKIGGGSIMSIRDGNMVEGEDYIEMIKRDLTIVQPIEDGQTPPPMPPAMMGNRPR